jgi:hypothetical protein
MEKPNFNTDTQSFSLWSCGGPDQSSTNLHCEEAQPAKYSRIYITVPAFKNSVQVKDF